PEIYTLSPHDALPIFDHRQAEDDRDGQPRVDHDLPSGRLRGVVRVEVELVGVHGQQGELRVVRLADRAAERVLIDVADGEVLVVTTDHSRIIFWRAVVPSSRATSFCARGGAARAGRRPPPR